ncbi:MAG TPA: SIS domain-containing protein, partial [Candidatus Paceibacterota bacterium]|nr:SIS domain-containing protein [Candidatus Paceibacterota bacterium]
FYASTPNEPLAGLAKTLFNETAKVPSFANVFPELDHNELQGFDGHAPELLERLVAVFIEDPADDARIKRRSALTRSLLEGRGVRTAGIALPEGSRADAFIALWQTARIAARSLAATAGVNSDATPLIEDFKRRL